jgi:hypothetical protein
MIITLANFKAYNNLSDDKTDDTLITNHIQYTQKIIEKYLGFPVEANDYEYSLDGSISYFIGLPIKPINTLTSLSIDGVAAAVGDFSIRDNHIINIDKSYVFTEGFQNIEVEVNAGFDEIPADIAGVALEIASLLWSEKGQNIGVTSKTIDDMGTRVFYKNTKFDDYLNRLRDYRVLI